MKWANVCAIGSVSGECVFSTNRQTAAQGPGHGHRRAMRRGPPTCPQLRIAEALPNILFFQKTSRRDAACRQREVLSVRWPEYAAHQKSLAELLRQGVKKVLDALTERKPKRYSGLFVFIFVGGCYRCIFIGCCRRFVRNRFDLFGRILNDGFGDGGACLRGFSGGGA